MAALLISAVSNESVNKDKTVAPPSGGPVAIKGAEAVIMDHSDLPTRFGDEDDVIEGKAAAAAAAAEAKKIPDGTGSVTNGKPDAKKHEAGKSDHYDQDSNEDHYDDDDYLISEHIQGKDDHDVDESESEYEDESDLGPTLDNFGAKLDGSDTGEELPIFLLEPQSAYVIRNRAAVLKCKAAHALQVSQAIKYDVRRVYFINNLLIRETTSSTPDNTFLHCEVLEYLIAPSEVGIMVTLGLNFKIN